MAVLKRDPPPLQQPIAHQGSLITTTPWALWFNKLLATVEFAPADPDGAVQFNNGGAFGGSSAFRYHDGFLDLSGAPVAATPDFNTLNVVTTFAPLGPTSNYHFGVSSVFNTGGPSNIAGDQLGIYGNFNHNGSGAMPEYGIGVEGDAFTTASGDAAYLIGVNGTTGSYGSGTITRASANGATHYREGSGHILELIGYEYGGFGLPHAGTDVIDTLYGVKLADVTEGGTNYAIYSGLGAIRFGEIAAPAAQTYAVVVDDDGVLSSTATPPGAGITQLTGDVTAGPGSGSQAATIAAHAVTFAKMQTIATQTLIGRDTAGTGDPESISISQALDWLTT